MKLKVSRRTVYVGTIVTMLAMIGGFAAATLAFSTIPSSNQNGFSSSLGNTVWSGASVSVSTGSEALSCSGTPTAAFMTGTQTISVSVKAPGSAGCNSGNFVEELSFVASTCPAGGTADNFVVFTAWSTSTPTATGSGAAASVGESVTGTLTGACTLNIYVDYGTSQPATAGLSISELSVVVSGS